MGETTNISWCDHTFNGWVGCTKVSPACDGCYAEAMMDKRYGRVQWGGPGKGAGTRSRTSEGNWREPIRWNRKAEKEGTRPFVFCSSLADVFDNQVPPEWRADLFNLIGKTPRLTWLLLTKRPQNIVKLFLDIYHNAPEIAAEADIFWPRNAAIGTTVEDQERADQNIPALLHAKHRLKPAFAFLSCEPLLGPIDLEYPESVWPNGPETCCSGHECGCMGKPIDPPLGWGVDWVITGGETDQGSHKARPTNPQWFRDIRDQCARASIPYHHKQNGVWVSVSEVEGDGDHYRFPDGRTVRRIGKKLSGRTIDGVTHDARPEVA